MELYPKTLHLSNNTTSNPYLYARVYTLFELYIRKLLLFASSRFLTDPAGTSMA